MKKFDLEKALSGERVITRNGKEVTGLHLFDVKDRLCLYGILGGEVHRWERGGTMFVCERNEELDLFMPGEKKTMWVNVYKRGGLYLLSDPYKTKEQALEYSTKELIDTIQITFEI